MNRNAPVWLVCVFVVACGGDDANDASNEPAVPSTPAPTTPEQEAAPAMPASGDGNNESEQSPTEDPEPPTDDTEVDGDDTEIDDDDLEIDDDDLELEFRAECTEYAQACLEDIESEQDAIEACDIRRQRIDSACLSEYIEIFSCYGANDCGARPLDTSDCADVLQDAIISCPQGFPTCLSYTNGFDGPSCDGHYALCNDGITYDYDCTFDAEAPALRCSCDTDGESRTIELPGECSLGRIRDITEACGFPPDLGPGAHTAEDASPDDAQPEGT